MTRRHLLETIAGGLTAVGAAPMSLEAAQHVHNAAEQEKRASGRYTPKFLNEHEYRTVQRLAELIVPADDVSGNAADAGAPEFIDLLCSANAELGDIYSGGLLWLDSLMRRRYTSTFVDATPQQQTGIMDELVAAARAEDASGELAPGLRFFNWVLKMTVDAFYTSPIGIKDIGFQGNGVKSEYVVPAEAIEYALKRSPLGKS